MTSTYLTLKTEEERLAYIMRMIHEGPEPARIRACKNCGCRVKRGAKYCSYYCARVAQHRDKPGFNKKARAASV